MLSKRVSRIILTRPAVEAGERLGFLPGTLQEKIDPYLRPLYDALYEMIEAEKVEKLLERNTIEIAPLAFMRGRTLNDSFIIMDEAQNTTPEQMKMMLTRQGFNSKMVVTGDATQIDLPRHSAAACIEAIEVLKSVEGISFVQFDERDVVRHNLVAANRKSIRACITKPSARIANRLCGFPDRRRLRPVQPLRHPSRRAVMFPRDRAR